MTEGTASAPPFFDYALDDISGSQYLFDATEWVDPPMLVFDDDDPDSKEVVCRRNANDSVYRRQFSTMKTWQRYVTLGYYALEDGSLFDMDWRYKESNPLRMHRMIWYNYMYHVDRDLDLPPKLDVWATTVTQPYLQVVDPDALHMDTMLLPWNKLILYMEKNRTVEGDWKLVGSRQRPKTEASTSGKRGPLTSPTQVQDSGCAFSPGFNPLPDDRGGVSSILKRKTVQIQTPSKSDNPVTLTATTEPVSTVSTQTIPTKSAMKASKSAIPLPKTQSPTTEIDGMSQMDEKPSATIPTSEVITNDGTHRLSFKWKIDGNVRDLAHDRQKMFCAIHAILTLLFGEDDGQLYRWESADLKMAKTIHEMTSSEVCDFLSPKITTITATSQLIFGVRFGFSGNPISWMSQANTKEVMKLNNLTVSVSNSICSSGKLVIAGYILLKHPTMTHKHRYLQYLRSLLPTATPFFDVVYRRQTPMDQDIGHLAVQCGENHVTPVCQALVKCLTGQTTAIFLPRYALATVSQDQLRNHFVCHEKYLRALKQLPLFPHISNLDLIRTEYNSDGSTTLRSTREWALALKVDDGKTHAKCDIVNGGKNRQPYLLIPHLFFTDIKEEWRKYRTSLAPVEQREARFRDGIPGLPDVIHISTSVKSNLEFLDKMSVHDVWLTPQASCKSTQADTKQSKVQTSSSKMQPQGASETRPKRITPRLTKVLAREWPSLVKKPTLSQQHQRPNVPPTTTVVDNDVSSASSDSSPHRETTSSTASTQSMTQASFRSTQSSRLALLEKEIKRQQTSLSNARQTSKDTSTRLQQIEQKLSKMDDLEDKLVTTMEAQTTIASTVSDMRDQMTHITNVLEQLSARFNESHQRRREGVPHHPEERSLSPQAQRNLFLRPEEPPVTSGSGSVSSRSKSSQLSDASTTIGSPQKKKQRPVRHDSDQLLSEARQSSIPGSPATSTVVSPELINQRFANVMTSEHTPSTPLNTSEREIFLTSASIDVHMSDEESDPVPHTTPSNPPNAQYTIHSDSAGWAPE